MNIEKWSNHFNFVAVDPEIIPLGSVVLILLNIEQIPFLAVDTGGAIKGYKLDLYFVDDQTAAYQFGRQNVIARIIQ
jgi:3D (Asp-Asp-Asp) domain-containing protein